MKAPRSSRPFTEVFFYNMEFPLSTFLYNVQKKHPGGVLALLIYEPYSSSKHSGVISYFNRHFIKEGIFPKCPGETFQGAFELRQDGDYKEFFELPADSVVDILTQSGHFIEEIRAYLKHTDRL